MDVCHHGRIRCWECARMQELEERVQKLEQAIREALGRIEKYMAKNAVNHQRQDSGVY